MMSKSTHLICIDDLELIIPKGEKMLEALASISELGNIVVVTIAGKSGILGGCGRGLKKKVDVAEELKIPPYDHVEIVQIL